MIIPFFYMHHIITGLLIVRSKLRKVLKFERLQTYEASKIN